MPAAAPVVTVGREAATPRSRNVGYLIVLIAIVAAVVFSWPKLRNLVKAGGGNGGPSESGATVAPLNVKQGTLTETPLKSGASLSEAATAKAPGSSAVPATGQPQTASTLAAQLLGSWRGGRHLTEFRADGTFVLDPDIVPEPVGGVWRLQGSRLTQAFREGNSLVLDIVSIAGREMVTRDPATAKEFKLHREDNAYLNPDQLATGDMRGDEFAAKGLRMKALTGRLFVYEAAAPMSLPGVRKKVIMIDGGFITKLSLEFDPPVRSFTMTLPPITGGSSFPTFTMTAFDRAGNGFDMIGREHWIPARPMTDTIKMDSKEMSRIEIAVDNRFGNTAWATFNCLPIMDMLLER